MSLHEQSVGATDEWYTPARVFDALGCRFDLDVAHPGSGVPCVPADRVLTRDGLKVPWSGFVWCNPPFGGRNGIAPWLARFMAHGNGIALTPDRTSAPWWHDYASQADALLFVRSKLKFVGADGREGRSPAQGTTLMARGDRAVAALQRAQSHGLGLVFAALQHRKEAA